MAKKTVIIVKATVDHPDCVPALLFEVAESIRKETAKGMIEKQDGDKVEWRTE